MKNLDILTKPAAFFVIFIHIRKSEQKKTRNISFPASSV
ncbi:hypothetical protein MY9_3743 [Bacillus sp. JS]|nr:hypothetical protein MY9_3743 [Bacillus sp. JS]